MWTLYSLIYSDARLNNHAVRQHMLLFPAQVICLISLLTYAALTSSHLRTSESLSPCAVARSSFLITILSLSSPSFLQSLSTQLWYHNRPHSSVTNKNRSRYFSACDVENRVPEAMKLHSAVLSNGELNIADINLADMDPEEIRSELRRIYTQFQILKNKTLRKDNPHISKRRGGRKGTHRRFSLQPFSHKPSASSIHHHHHSHRPHGKSSVPEYDETEVSRTPEESTTSVEGNPAAAESNSGGKNASGPRTNSSEEVDESRHKSDDGTSRY